MEPAALSPLAGWESFYVIAGTSAAALTGLQFVVIALVAEQRTRSSTREIDAFGTPTVVHFGAALLASAILSAPWRALSSAALALGLAALAGIVYVAIVIRRATQTTGYKPVLEDWIFHAVLPFVAYAAGGVAAATLPRRPEPSLFVFGAVTLLLLFIGIHNAWDTVTYLAVTQRQQEQRERPGESGEAPVPTPASTDAGA